MNEFEKLIKIYQELLGETKEISYPHIWQIPKLTIEDVEWIPWEFIESILKKLKLEREENIRQQELIEIINPEEFPIERERGREWYQPDIFERCAWYQSHHFWPNFYGIFIREDCIQNIAKELYHIDDIVFQRCNHFYSWTPAYLTAMALLFVHELYHYNIDLVITYLECVMKELDIYSDYFNNYYSPNFRTKDCIEESLANRYVFGRSKYLKVEKFTLAYLFSKQPPGYQEYANFLGQNFHNGERDLLQIILDHGKMGTKKYLYDLSLDQLFKRLNQIKHYRGYEIPIYLVISKTKRYIRIFGAYV